MRRTLVLLATLLAVSLIGVQPSRAQFAECTDEYVNSFRIMGDEAGERWSWYPGQLDCHEFWRFSFDTPAGPRWIRLIGDADAATTLQAGSVEMFRDAAQRATRAMRNLGVYRVDNITMMISPPRPNFYPSIHNVTPTAWAIRSAAKAQFEECHVTLMFTAADNAPPDIHHNVGHEIFHCIEQSSLSSEQWATISGLGKWWLEGAAELFGAVAAGARSARYDRTSTFEASVRARQPLYEQDYGAALFWFWHYRENGLDALLPLLRQMAGTGSAAAQMTAMSAALPVEDWRHFAQAYDDRRIFHPTGAPLPFGDRVEGETWSIEEATSTHERELRRFVLETGWADYACGVWANEVNASSIEVRPENSADWGPWPASFNTEGLIGVRLRVATMTSMADVDLVLAADKREACRTCDVSRAIDACVVGRWRQTGGGPLEYLRSRGVPITMAAQDPLVLTMTAEGTFSTNAIRTSVQMVQQMPRGNTMTGTGAGTTSPVHGRWSAQGGILQGCIDSGGRPEGTTIISSAGLSTSVPWGGSVAGTSGGTEYSCSDTTLSTSSPTEHGPMTYTFTRETPPPRRR